MRVWRLCRNGFSCRWLARGRCDYPHLDPETELRLATEPTTEEEKEQRRVAEEKKEEHAKMLKEKNKQQRIAETEERRRRKEEEKKKAERRAAHEKRQAEAILNKEENKKKRSIEKIKRKAEEKQKAEEACSRIPDLPGELQVYILHHFPLKQLEQLELPVPLLRLVLQVKGPPGAQQLVRSSWLHRVQRPEDAAHLQGLARRAGLAPACGLTLPSLYDHYCRPLCSWFAPVGGWEATYARNPWDYRGCNDSDEEDDYGYSDESDYNDEFDHLIMKI